MRFSRHEFVETGDGQAGVRMRTVVAVSVAVHLLFLAIIGTIAGTSEGDKKKKYISVDLIRNSGAPNQRLFAARPKSVNQNKPEPTEIKRSESAPETTMTLHPQIAPADSPAPKETTDPLPGSVSNAGSNYIGVHRASRPPVFRKRVVPEYPVAERNAGREARVIVEVEISESGAVDSVKVVKSGGKVFDEAALKAAKETSFEPGYLDGRQIGVRMQIPYVFRLR